MRMLLLGLAAATSLVAAAPTLAQNVGLRAHPEINLTGFSGDPTALPKAVTNIESLTGGRVIEIRYNNAAGAPGYDAVVAQGSTVKFQRFSSPEAGVIDLTQTSTPAWMLNWQAKRDVRLGENAKVPLIDAIRAAESDKGGPAVAAGIARSAASPGTDVHAYNVAILKDGRQHRVAVDSATGSVIEDPQALDDW